jgi:argininosuccinate lyase
MTTEMLHLRDRALSLHAEITSLINTLLALSEEHISTIMPGYTHMQPAKPTTFGQWALAYADALFRNLSSLQYTWEEYDACPLGAVESYGTSWPIDRSLTANLLGFARVWEIPQDAIASRGMPQLAYLDACKNIGMTLSKLNADLLLFTTWEYNYLRLGEAVAQRLHPITGSSVMPQKRNPDALELLRASTQEIVSIAGAASNLLAGLPMGYNRDTRQMKEWSALGFGKTQEALHMLNTILSTLWVDRDRMLRAVKANYSSSTDLADAVAQASGVGYRQVYAIVGKLVDTMIQEDRPLHTITAQAINDAAHQADIDLNITDEQIQSALDPHQAVAARKHTGGSESGEMERLLQSRKQRLTQHVLWHDKNKAHIVEARTATLSHARALQGTVQSTPVS